MEFGQLIGPLFFILLSIAALSSSISILEPGTAYLAEEGFLSRKKSAFLISILCWILGIGTALGFNIYADSNGENPFLNNVELISVQILLPFGGMMIAIFVGWFMNESLVRKEITSQYPVFYKLWRFFIKFIAPLSVAFIFISQLI